MKKISIIVPCFNEEEVLPMFYKEMKKIMEKMKKNSFELIFVNDGSNDKTLEVIKKFATKDKRIRFISFTKNFGKEAAMLAGLDYCTGDYVAVMDADLQDPPHLIEKMVKIIEEEGYECVGTRRVTRKGEPPIRSFFARTFYKFINKISDVEMIDGARDFRLMTRRMVNSIISMREYNRYSKGLWNLPGFKTKWLGYENLKRQAGTTKWTFLNLCTYALECIVDFTNFPLVVAFFIGIFLCFISLIVLIFYFINNFNFNYLLVFLLLMIGGTQLIFSGIIGLYFSKTYTEIKKRPIYVINETEKEDKNV